MMPAMDFNVQYLGTENTTPEGFFVNAIGWDYSAEILNADCVKRISAARNFGAELKASRVQFRLPTLKPFIVASALAIELYIKCLLRCEQVPVNKVHLLNELFDLASAGAQKRIEELYEEFFANDAELMELKSINTAQAEDFLMHATIKRCSRVFVEWRYYHEGIATADNPHLSPLRHALRKYLAEQNPRWKDFLERVHNT